MWYVFGLLGIGGLGLAGIRVFQADRRQRRLDRENRVKNWTFVTQEPHRFTRIVRINFGFGQEVWAIDSEGDEIDSKLRAFSNGVLVKPRPRLSGLADSCRLHELEYVQRVVKWR